jgi:membrane protease YdiL (CAAX protease family)
VAITAGICEQILYRDFLFGFLRAWSGMISAIVISSIAFGWAHIYFKATGSFLEPRSLACS